MTVYRLEGAVVPNLIHSHIVSRVLGLSPSSVMPSESQGFQDKSYSFVQKGVTRVTKKKKKGEPTSAKAQEKGSPQLQTMEILKF